MNVVEYVMSLRDKNFNSGIRKAGKGVGDVDKKISKLNSNLSGLNNGFKSIIATAGLFAIGKEIITTVSEFEKYNAVLTNTFQSQEKAKKSLKDITEFASKTPFQVNNLTGAYVKLSNQGFVPTIKQMTKLGDLASSTGKGFDQLAEAVLDAQVGEFERLKEFGVKAKKEGKKVSFSFKGVTKTVDNSEKGIRNYLLSLGDVVGVSGAMAAISKTLGGKISNLKDKITQLFLNLGQKLKPIIEIVIQLFNDGIIVIQNVANWIENSMLGFDGLAIVIGVIVAAITVWIAVQKVINILLFANPIGLVVLAIAALVAGIVIAYKRSETFRGIMTGLFSVLSVIGGYIKDILIKAFQLWWANAKRVGSAILDFLKKPIDLAIESFKKFISFLEKIPGVGKLIKNLRNSFSEGFKKGVKDFRKEQEKTKIGAEVGGFASAFGLGKSPVLGGATGVSKATSNTNKVTSAAPKQFNINVEKVGNFEEVNFNNVQEGVSQIKEMITKALLESLADIEIAR